MKTGKLYIRLSNTRGDDISVDRQLGEGHKYLASRKDVSHRCETDDLIEPVGWRSGTTENRPKFKELKQWIENNEGGLVWVYNQARFKRGDIIALLEKMHKNEIEFVIGTKTINLDLFDDEVQVMTNSFLDLMYARRLSHDQRRRIRNERAAGAWWGRTPLGTELSGKGQKRRLTASKLSYTIGGKSRKYLDTIVTFFKMYTAAEPVGMPTIARRLNERGYRWWNMQREPVIINEVHLHNINPIAYQGIIDDELIQNVLARQRARSGKKQNGRRPQHPPALLWRVLRCADCGECYYLGNRYHTKGRVYPSYKHFRSASLCNNFGLIATHKIDEQVLEIVEPFLNLSEDEKRRLAEKATQEQKDHSGERRQELKTRLSRIEDLAIDGLLSKEKYVAEREKVLRELEAIPEPLYTSVRTASDYVALFNKTKNLIQQIGALDPYLANALIRDIFNAIYIEKGQVVRYELRDNFKAWVENGHGSRI